MSRIFLIRHGQASWGKRNYDVLSKKGIQQSQILGAHLASWQIKTNTIISGDHKRHIDTAQVCLQSMHVETTWSEDVKWNEFDFQNIIECYKPMYKVHSLMLADLALRGSTQENFKLMFEQAIVDWIQGSNNSIYKETWPIFKQRILNALASLKQYGEGKDILIFTSGGVIGIIVSHLLNVLENDITAWRTLTKKIINTSITQLHFKDNAFSLVSFNEHGHLLGNNSHLYSTH